MEISFQSSALVAEVADYLRRYCRDELDAREINRLIKLASVLAQKRFYYRLLAAARAQETSVEQTALSVVADLFSKRGEDVILKTAIQDSLEGDDISLFLHFQSVVVRTASQELFHRWGENDPMSAKLWRNLQRAIRHDPRLVAFPGDKPRWIAIRSKDPKENLRPGTFDEMSVLANRISLSGQSTADLAYELIMQMQDISKAPQAVAVEILFAVLRDKVIREAGVEMEARFGDCAEDPLLRTAIEKANRFVMIKIDELLAKYRKTGKLDSSLAESFKRALSDLLDDLADGEQAQSYFQYLQPYQPEIDYEQYRTLHRPRFEYLAEIMKKTFLGKMREFFDKQYSAE